MRTFVGEAKRGVLDAALERIAEGHDPSEGAAFAVDARDPRGAEFALNMMVRCGLAEAEARRRLTAVLSEAERTDGFPISVTWFEPDGLASFLRGNRVSEEVIAKPPPKGSFRAVMLGEGKVAIHILPLPKAPAALSDFREIAIREAATSAQRRQRRGQDLSGGAFIAMDARGKLGALFALASFMKDGYPQESANRLVAKAAKTISGGEPPVILRWLESPELRSMLTSPPINGKLSAIDDWLAPVSADIVRVLIIDSSFTMTATQHTEAPEA